MSWQLLAGMLGSGQCRPSCSSSRSTCNWDVCSYEATSRSCCSSVASSRSSINSSEVFDATRFVDASVQCEAGSIDRTMNRYYLCWTVLTTMEIGFNFTALMRSRFTYIWRVLVLTRRKTLIVSSQWSIFEWSILKMGQPRPLCRLLSVFSNKQYNSYNK